MIVIWLITACSSSSKTLTDSAEQNTITETNEPSVPEDLTELSPEILFTVPNRPWDIALHPDGRLFCSAQTGGKLYAWNPTTQEREDVNGQFEGILAIGFQDTTFIFSTTADTNTGALVQYNLEDDTSTILTTQSDDGTLIRWPIDIELGPDSSWFIADYNAQTVFHLDANGNTSTLNSGSTKPTTVLFSNNILYTGGDDGIFSLELGSNDPNMLDERPTAGLSIIDNTLIAAGNPNGVFVVGGSVIGFDGPARHGAMLYNGSNILVTDRIGEGVWTATP